MSTETNPKVKIISKDFIKPKYEINRSNRLHYLSAHDLLHLSTPYMHRGLLYAKPPSLSSINSLVDNLKESMSIALVDFYPLAGRLSTTKYEEEHASWVYVDPDAGPGATIVHATAVSDEYKVTMSDILMPCGSFSRFIWSFFDMGDLRKVNHDGHNEPLLCVQVTDLVDGVFIGFTMSHMLGDGTSLWHFIRVLSHIFMGFGDDFVKPIFKTMFADGYGPVLKLPYLDPGEFVKRNDVDTRLSSRVFCFSAEVIARLKAQARENNNHNNNAISSFQALAAFMWLSVARARDLPGDSDMNCWLSADTRPKHDPPLPSNHFGNFIYLIMATSKMDDLMKNGLCRAATLLHEGVMGVDQKLVLARMKALAETPGVSRMIKKHIGVYSSNPPLTFAGSTRFNAYGPEFGLGKPVTTRTGHNTWKDGRIIVNPGREGDGSVDLQVCLLAEIMTALESDNEFMSYVS